MHLFRATLSVRVNRTDRKVRSRDSWWNRCAHLTSGALAGVWTIAPRTSWAGPKDVWIEVRDSQFKFNDAQTNSFVFELHSVPSGVRTSAKLGKQMFEVLVHCGVPASALRAIFKQQIADGACELGTNECTQLLILPPEQDKRLSATFPRPPLYCTMSKNPAESSKIGP